MFSLPALKDTIDEQLRSCYIELGMLPAPLATDPSTEFLLLVTNFCNDFRAAVAGEARKTLVQHSRRQYHQLKLEICSTCPDFRPFEDCTKYRVPISLSLEEPVGYAGRPLDLNEVQKLIDKSVVLSVLEGPTLTSISQFHRVGVTRLCPIRRSKGTHPRYYCSLERTITCLF
jgi:vacuolar protein sorting-associated protein 1